MSTHDTMGEAAREALVAITVANDAATMFDAVTRKLETAARTVDPRSQDGQSLDALLLSIARARNALHAAVVSAPLTTWQFLVERTRHVGAAEVAAALNQHPSSLALAEVLA